MVAAVASRTHTGADRIDKGSRFYVVLFDAELFKCAIFSTVIAIAMRSDERSAAHTYIILYFLSIRHIYMEQSASLWREREKQKQRFAIKFVKCGILC